MGKGIWTGSVSHIVAQHSPMNKSRPPPMPGALRSIFTRDALRLPPKEWRALREKTGVLPDADEAVIQDLRRKSMSCVYAERSRERRTLKLQTALAQATALKAQVKELEDENRMLRDRIRDLSDMQHSINPPLFNAIHLQLPGF